MALPRRPKIGLTMPLGLLARREVVTVVMNC